MVGSLLLRCESTQLRLCGKAAGVFTNRTGSPAPMPPIFRLDNGCMGKDLYEMPEPLCYQKQSGRSPQPWELMR